MSGHGQKQSSDTEWTLILWDIENVAVPEELRHAAGVQLLTETLKAEFATKLNKELHCIKLACRWSHPQSPYSDLLGSLTTLGDVEALSYQWQGHPGDKVHNADRMLRRAADRFMHMMERKGPNRPQHLVVFITSDEDFSEKVTELRARNFDVQIGQQVANITTVNVLAGRNRQYMAILDFGAAPNPAQQAADAVARLDGQFWGTTKVRAELYPPTAASAAAIQPVQPVTNSAVNEAARSPFSCPSTAPSRAAAWAGISSHDTGSKISPGGMTGSTTNAAAKPTQQASDGTTLTESTVPSKAEPRLDPADQKLSELRRYTVVLQNAVHNIDLVEMLMGREDGGKELCLSVWRVIDA
ncbi:hypothetical protein WJX79_007831 [Trebouxia sp. C0005]